MSTTTKWVIGGLVAVWLALGLLAQQGTIGGPELDNQRTCHVSKFTALLGPLNLAQIRLCRGPTHGLSDDGSNG